ncbi:proton channel OtopLc isoform X1 [Lepeophtheirus salmonis]|nr:proton channel OtopLc-like isoform X1 [Lepeophtheirus salmonis]
MRMTQECSIDTSNNNISDNDPSDILNHEYEEPICSCRRKSVRERRHLFNKERPSNMIVKPSEIFGSLKKKKPSSSHAKFPCQCKHHQIKYLEKQEEQRRRLKHQLIQRGDWKKASYLQHHGNVSLLDEPQDQDSLDGALPGSTSLPHRNLGDHQHHHHGGGAGAQSSSHNDLFKSQSVEIGGARRKHRKIKKETSIQSPVHHSESSIGDLSDNSDHMRRNKKSSPNDNPNHETQGHHSIQHHSPLQSNSHIGSANNNNIKPSSLIHSTMDSSPLEKSSSAVKQISEKSAKASSSISSTRSVMTKFNPFAGSLWDRRESYSHLWITLSSMYGKFLVLLMLAFCLTEVMDNKIRPLQFQGIYMMYLYVGSILAIMSIYVSVLIDNCPSITNEHAEKHLDPELGSLESINGTLKRAHIDRTKISRTSFYLRIGALVFGLGTLIFNGLEIAMHATMNESCVGNLLLAHPVLQALFTFLQMHFLFINSQVIVERFGFFARFGFMHLLATNVALWVRTIIWESANDWIHYIYYQQYGIKQTGGVSRMPNFSPVALSLREGLSGRNNYFADRSFETDSDYLDGFATPDFPGPLRIIEPPCNASSPISKEHLNYVVELYQCFNDNTLGRLWTSSMPYVFPFIVEYRVKIEVHFSLIAAAVTYIMWKNVGKDKIEKKNFLIPSTSTSKKIYSVVDEAQAEHKKRKAYWRVDCQSVSKGLFLGLLCLVGGIVILIIFFVMKDREDFREKMFWIYSGAELFVLGLSILGCLGGFVQIQKLSHSFRQPYDLDKILASVTLIGAYIYAIFSIISAGSGDYSHPHNMAVISTNGLIIIQVTLQGMIISEASRRVCATRNQQYSKPGRQLITFLLFVNITLWILDTFMTHSWITQELQLDFYGVLTWGIISRISLPLMIFYRFHSCVVLVEIWKNTYRTKESL